MVPRRGVSAGWLLAVASAFALAGCGGGARQASPQAAQGIMTVLGLEYGDYLARHGNATPFDAAQFRSFVESRPDKLAEYRVGSVDDLFTSPRDGQPVRIVCGVKQPVVDDGGYAVAAYEATGVGGSRLVANMRGAVREMTAAEFAEAFLALGP